MNWKIPLFKIYWDEEDIQAVNKVIKRGSSWANGPEIAELEKAVSSYIGNKYGVAFNSGTSALHSALLSLGLKSGEVIVPSFTFVSTANSILLAGLTPVFADIEEETCGLDAKDVENKISDKTKAVVLVHYAGCGARDTIEIKKLCQERGILLIEDAAESLGASICDQKIGSFGDIAMFSFCQNKVVSGGEGGMIVTNDQKIYEKLKLFRSHGRLEASDVDYFSSTEESNYVELGYNYRMPTMIAGLVLSQFKKIDFLIKKRNEKANFFKEKLPKNIKTPFIPEGFNHVYQIYPVLLEDEKIRNSLRDFLKENGVMSKVYFNPVHESAFYKNNAGSVNLPVTKEISSKILTLPLYVDMTKEEISLIVNLINKFFEGDIQ